MTTTILLDIIFLISCILFSQNATADKHSQSDTGSSLMFKCYSLLPLFEVHVNTLGFPAANKQTSCTRNFQPAITTKVIAPVISPNILVTAASKVF